MLVVIEQLLVSCFVGNTWAALAAVLYGTTGMQFLL